MEKILVINTGGTFNKRYNPLTGELEVDKEGQALTTLSEKWMHPFEVLNIIGKDSLEITGHDRLELLATIHQSTQRKILVVHGTDTMDVTAAYLADAELEKQIVLTGSMVPFSIDPTEATANFASAYTALQVMHENGVFIAMHGHIAPYQNLQKDRTKGRFIHLD